MTEYSVPIIIDGVERRTSSFYDVVNPSNGRVCHRSVAASSDDAFAAIESSAIAFREWRKSTPSIRRDILLKAADIMERRSNELAEYMIVETGASEGWTEFNLKNTMDLMRDIAGRVSSIVGTAPTLADSDRSGIIIKEPYGVVFAVAPWNSPYILGARAVIQPIAAGNTVVLKGSELSPRCLCAIVSVLNEAGLPKGVLNFISTDEPNAAEVTRTIIGHRHVKKITFTGSTSVGRIIAELAAKHLKPVVLELGGQAPAIVWKDANLDLAAISCAAGSFLYAGQCCMSTERIIVHKDVCEEFKKKFVAAIPTISPAKEESTLMITGAGAKKTSRLVQDAEKQGAVLTRIDIGPTSIDNLETRLQPVVIGNVATTMDIYRHENFGPTAYIIEVSSEEEALVIANDTEYGLASAIFTEDLRVGLRFARQIEAGAVHINNMSIHDEAALPHGGCKATGYGRFNTDVGLSEWYRTKNITWRN
ncbi:aldehyde dehydrogenase domain-containing protein [Xylariaceae sp. FL1272]|nr:aldehyde dehydrogenase domain-containing protein [Xylariaceae sp. FL1272]